MRARVRFRAALVTLAIGVVLGAALGVAAMALTDPDPAPDAVPSVSHQGTLDALPEAPVEVIAETVRLPASFGEAHVHGGPTLNTVLEGVVDIRAGGATTRYEPGDFFFEPPDLPHRITVVEAARLHVVRLLPPGAEATTEVDSGEVE